MKNRKMKIGLSLLIAMAFIIPAGSILADKDPIHGTVYEQERPKAGDYKEMELELDPSMAVKLDDVNPQTGDVLITDVVAENPDGEQILMYDGITIPLEDFYQFYVGILNLGPGTAQVKPHLELYKEIADPTEIILYETSFEDNCDIYNNWVQIDEDCALGGYFDTFSWSDARASDGDHSMKNTMYDIYKGNQNDYLQCTKVFDISDQAYVEIQFDCWVEGQYNEWWASGGNSIYTPIDYLDFEVYDLGWWNPYGETLYDHYNPTVPFVYPNYVTNTMAFVYSYPAFMSGAQYWFDTTIAPYQVSPFEDYLNEVVDLGGGWWHVTVTLPVSWFWDPYNVQFRFSWVSDPQFQYEGAYVDNFKVISLEAMKEKIFQTHSQGPQEWEPEVPYFFEFPLKWTTVEEGCYTLLLWVENHDGLSFNDWPYYVEIDFCVGDEVDCEITDLLIEDSFTQEIVLPEGRMTQGADAHIVFDYHNNGNVPVEDVVITASAYKKTWETVYSTDFEGMIWADHGAFSGPDLWHKSNFDSWSGSNCMACFNDDTRHYENNMYINYVIGPNIDMYNVEEMYMDYYAKWITEGSVDRALFMLYDPATNYVLGCGSPYNFYGFQPQWVGPMQPLGWYQPFNVKAYYDLWIANYGMFTNPDGSQSYDLGLGFRVQSTDADTYTNAYAEEMGVYWSGWMFDDISVRSLEIATTPTWTDSIIIPGPLEPCDTYHDQFEWEDVPYCMYKICVEAECEGDIDMDDNILCQQIYVVDDLEWATDPKVESTDLTVTEEGGWGLCGPDYDWYLSTNPDSETYASNLNAVAMLCPDGEPCMDISHLVSGGGGTATTIFSEDFESGFGLWTVNNYGTGLGWLIDYYGSGAYQEPNGGGTYYANVDSDYSGGDEDTSLITPPIDLSVSTGPVTLQFESGYQNFAGYDLIELWLLDLGVRDTLIFTANTDLGATFEQFSVDWSGMIDPTTAQFEFYYVDFGNWCWNWGIDDVEVIGWIGGGPATVDLEIEFDYWCDMEYGYDGVMLEIVDGCVDPSVPDDWIVVWSITGEELWTGGWQHAVVDLGPYITGNEFMLRFVAVSDSGTEMRGFLLDNVFIDDLFDVTQITDPFPVYEDFFDDFSTDDDFCIGDDSNWCLDASFGWGQYWEYVPDNEWCTTFPAYPVLDALVWETEIADAYEAYLTFEESYQFAANAHGTIGHVRISADGGENWYILEDRTGSSASYVTKNYDISFWAGSEVLIQFLVDGQHAALAGYTPTAGYWCVRNIYITGKQDNTPPVTTIQMSGTQNAGWYSTPVKVKITATDDAGMGAIHYILDGKETVVPGYVAEFTVTANGAHNLEYWGVDATGNVETHHTVPTFYIDLGTPPVVDITAPEPGLYLFGNKLLSSSKIFIIGAFTIEATATDAESGVYKVAFYLDGDLIGEDTSAPYSTYCAVKHMGAGVIKAVAEDFSMNAAEDTLDVKYYKFL